MTPRRKQPATASGFRIRLPDDVMQRIEAKAKAQTTSINRVVINELAQFPDLEPSGAIADRLRDLEVIMASYGGRITWLELSEQLLNSVDALLKAEGAAVHGAIDRVRVARTAMLKTPKAKQ